MDPREDRLAEPHVRPLMALVHGLRARGLEVPNVDPNDGGANATALFLLESPGPRAVTSYFVSRDNPDPSAKNLSVELDIAGFARAEVLLWNVVPHCVSTKEQNRNASPAQVREAIPDTQAFLDCLPALRVVVFCGRRAQRAQQLLRLRDTVTALSTFHPGAMSYNHLRCREDIRATFKQAREWSR